MMKEAFIHTSTAGILLEVSLITLIQELVMCTMYVCIHVLIDTYVHIYLDIVYNTSWDDCLVLCNVMCVVTPSFRTSLCDGRCNKASIWSAATDALQW